MLRRGALPLGITTFTALIQTPITVSDYADMLECSSTHYVRLGGEAGVRRLVDRFYDLMEQLPEAREIRALHPPDLASSREKLFKFLSGWLGGPSLYIAEYGHPRLRARHLPFPIGPDERDAWLRCMTQALSEIDLDELLRDHLLQSLRQLADHMRNQ